MWKCESDGPRLQDESSLASHVGERAVRGAEEDTKAEAAAPASRPETETKSAANDKKDGPIEPAGVHLTSI